MKLGWLFSMRKHKTSMNYSISPPVTIMCTFSSFKYILFPCEGYYWTDFHQLFKQFMLDHNSLQKNIFTFIQKSSPTPTPLPLGTTSLIYPIKIICDFKSLNPNLVFAGGGIIWLGLIINFALVVSPHTICILEIAANLLVGQKTFGWSPIEH